MKAEKQSETRDSLETVRAVFEQWRNTRKKKGRIPETLWEAATDLSASYPICKIAKALRLDFKELKRRIGDGSRGSTPSEFMEINAEHLFSAGQCIVEVRSVGGNSLKILTGAGSAPQWEGLLSCFLSHSR